MTDIFSKKTRKSIRKREKEFRKAEREGRVIYDDISHTVRIRRKEDEQRK